MVLLALTITAGLGSRSWRLGWSLWDKSLGDALYAIAVYLVLKILIPHLRAPAAGITAVLFCLGIEAFKFTGLPGQWSAWSISRLILGSTPSWHNVVCYCVGIAGATAIDAFVSDSAAVKGGLAIEMMGSRKFARKSTPGESSRTSSSQ